MNWRKNKSKRNYSAFFMIEALVSLFIFSMALAAVMGMMTMEVKKAAEKRNETIAGQLAQEGIELVRNIRDNNWLSGEDAFNGIQSSETNSYTIDYDRIELSDSHDSRIYFSNGLYSHDISGEETVFRRGIIISAGDHQRMITSFVTWETNDFPNNEAQLSDCNVGNKCFFTQVTLSDNWGKVE